MCNLLEKMEKKDIVIFQSTFRTETFIKKEYKRISLRQKIDNKNFKERT